MTINYSHGDSSPLGNVSIDTLRKVYDNEGHVVAELHTNNSIPQSGSSGSNYYYNRYLDYTSRGDTIIKKVESSYDTTNPWTVVNIDRWERTDDQPRPGRHYRLYVMRMPNKLHDTHDTIYHFSQRFAYDSVGRLSLAWFDHMNLWRFYTPSGPDTIQYEYNHENRLVAERHRYTTDMSNKSEPDTTGLMDSDKESIGRYREKFFMGDKYFPNSNRTDVVTYQYELFDPAKHLPLKIPIVD